LPFNDILSKVGALRQGDQFQTGGESEADVRMPGNPEQVDVEESDVPGEDLRRRVEDKRLHDGNSGRVERSVVRWKKLTVVLGDLSELRPSRKVRRRETCHGGDSTGLRTVVSCLVGLGESARKALDLQTQKYTPVHTTHIRFEYTIQTAVIQLTCQV